MQQFDAVPELGVAQHDDVELDLVDAQLDFALQLEGGAVPIGRRGEISDLHTDVVKPQDGLPQLLLIDSDFHVIVTIVVAADHRVNAAAAISATVPSAIARGAGMLEPGPAKVRDRGGRERPAVALEGR